MIETECALRVNEVFWVNAINKFDAGTKRILSSFQFARNVKVVSWLPPGLPTYVAQTPHLYQIESAINQPFIFAFIIALFLSQELILKLQTSILFKPLAEKQRKYRITENRFTSGRIEHNWRQSFIKCSVFIVISCKKLKSKEMDTADESTPMVPLGEPGL